MLHRSERQLGGTIEWHELCDELKGKPLLNACILDFLKLNPSFAPDEMKKGKNGDGIASFILFGGTTYRNFHKKPCIRACSWGNGYLKEIFVWLDIPQGFNCYVAYLA